MSYSDEYTWGSKQACRFVMFDKKLVSREIILKTTWFKQLVLVFLTKLSRDCKQARMAIEGICCCSGDWLASLPRGSPLTDVFALIFTGRRSPSLGSACGGLLHTPQRCRESVLAVLYANWEVYTLGIPHILICSLLHQLCSHWLCSKLNKPVHYWLCNLFTWNLFWL